MALKHILATAMVALLLTGCEDDDDNGSDPVEFSQLVVFGDSLSDVGTYAVGTVAALGGGKYTINGPSGSIWVENLANEIGVPVPCAAQTGLNGDASLGFNVPVTNFPECFGYAQGGSRVTNPIGPGNAALGGANATLGQLTVPLLTQIESHLAKGAFSGTELVTVLAGGNDVFINLGSISETFTPTDAVNAMGQAGAELAAYVNQLIIANGANYVLVVKLPDVSKNPFGYSFNDADTEGLIELMSFVFNDQLAKGLATAGDKVALVQAYNLSQDQAINPSDYGISNNTGVACNLDPAVNPLESALVCTEATVLPEADSGYQFADSVHPTPFGHTLLSGAAMETLMDVGWR